MVKNYQLLLNEKSTFNEKNLYNNDLIEEVNVELSDLDIILPYDINSIYTEDINVVFSGYAKFDQLGICIVKIPLFCCNNYAKIILTLEESNFSELKDYFEDKNCIITSIKD